MKVWLILQPPTLDEGTLVRAVCSTYEKVLEYKAKEGHRKYWFTVEVEVDNDGEYNI